MHNLMIIFSIVLIEIIQPKVNLGTIKEGDVKKVVFKIKITQQSLLKSILSVLAVLVRHHLILIKYLQKVR